MRRNLSYFLVACFAALLFVPIVPLELEAAGAPETPVRHMDSLTDNFNILFLGADGGKLLSCCVYSVNPTSGRSLRSASIFIPNNGLFDLGSGPVTLEEIYLRGGIGEVYALVEREMEIKMDYYLKVDRKFMADLQSVAGPINVKGEEICMADLFDRPVAPGDEEIMAEMLRSLVRPRVFFTLPRLAESVRENIETDFEPTPKNLFSYYRLAVRIDPTHMHKVVLAGSTCFEKGHRDLLIPEPDLENAIYLATAN